MQTAASHLIRWAGLPAMVAGILFVVIQPIHPSDTLASVTTGAWAAVHYLTITMCLLGIFGITGLYARQVNKAGWLGLAGYILLILWLALTMAYVFVEAFVLRLVAADAPAFVQSYLGLASSVPGTVDLGALAGLWTVVGLLYMVGGLLFGIATLRAGILSRWAGGLLAVGAVSALMGAIVPHPLNRLAAVPVGVALAWLGYALWSERRTHVAAQAPAGVEFYQAGAK